MVQQMLDKFNECILIHSRSAMPTGDKEHPVSVKKVALSELPNNSRNIISQPPENSPLPKDTGPVMDSVKVFGTKRQQPDCPSSPSSHQPLGNKGVNRHLVYVRRKLETEQGKTSTCANVDSTDSPGSRNSSNDETKEPKVQQDRTEEPNVLPHSHGKSITGFEPNKSVVTAATPAPLDPRSIQHWRERFLLLQTFLRNCDQSSQEDYKRMLRSLSPAGRSRHAFELEKRAIHLLLEEGKELHHMQVLNIIGEATSQDHASVSTKTPPLQAQFQRTEKTIHNTKLPFLRNGY